MAELRFPTNPPGRAFDGTTHARRRRLDPAIAWAFGCIALVLLIGSLYSSSFLSPQYLLQQLKVASFLGVIATGAMIVILLGQIDLSVPWIVAVGGMMATAATGWGAFGEALAIPIGTVMSRLHRGRAQLRAELVAADAVIVGPGPNDDKGKPSDERIEAS